MFFFADFVFVTFKGREGGAASGRVVCCSLMKLIVDFDFPLDKGVFSLPSLRAIVKIGRQ